MIEWLEEVGARLVVIDIDLDTSTDEGQLAARALALPMHHALTREDASLVADAVGTALREEGGAGS